MSKFEPASIVSIVHVYDVIFSSFFQLNQIIMSKFKVASITLIMSFIYCDCFDFLLKKKKDRNTLCSVFRKFHFRENLSCRLCLHAKF